ncbi:hypothetical protein JHK82_018780 [Glycine max]|nr:hypothetical protein JHK85_019222 [Glycine max]KAG5037957.1 hypothetical protein JHK86_018797 [Glycine max]KAG5143085.1 hypothetical protein JHK82_018780 [Glycine max]
MPEVYTVKVEEGRPATDAKPSAGPVYRSIYAKDGLLEVPSDFESPWDFFRDSVKRNPNNKMLGRRQKTESKVGSYTWLTYQDVYDAALKMGSAMRSRGVNPACNSCAASYVPLYDTLGPNAVEFIINHAEVSIAFVQEKKIPSILSCLAQCSSNLKTIVSFGSVSTTQKKEAEEHGASCFSWGEFLQLGCLDWDLPSKKKNDICTIMYTSGTTGDPKGVVIKNEAFMAEVLSVDHIIMLTDRVDVRFLLEDVQALKPTIFCGVPRVFDRIYAGIKSKVSSAGGLQSTLFQCAYNYKLKSLEKGLPQHKAAPLFDRLVFDKTKLALGGRVRILLSGAAPLPRHVEEFMRVTSGSTLSQGYGLTESCAGCFTAIGDVYSMTGTVGVPMTTIEARLESVPEMGYDALSNVPRGEICLRGNTLFSGYHKREDLTKEVMVDGWFHTGDIGEWQSNGAMKIIDRKKNIFKLSQGEYIAVENIENKYLQCPLIASIWVYGNSFESFLVAVVIPERTVIEDWAKEHNVTDDFKSLCDNLKARKYILDELNSTGQKHQLRGFELLKAIHLEPIPFDMERDLITPTFKLKRPQLLKYYKDRIDQLYKEAKGAMA